MSLLLGVDAGGTRTTFALAEGQHVLARTQAGSIKPLRVSVEQAREHFAAAMAALEKQSGRRIAEVNAVSIGTAGVRLPQTAGWMRELVAAHTKARLEVCGDEEIALDAAFAGGRGVLVIAGTGSNVMGRARDGQRCHVGGWGPVLGDEGSGYWIGIETLRTALRTYDFGEKSAIFPEVLAAWQCASIEEMVDRAHAVPPPDFSRLAPLVNACAEAGDAVCVRVLDRGGRLLGEAVAEVCRQVMALDRGPAPAVAYIGSAISRIPALRQALACTLHEAFPDAVLAAEPVDAVDGALWRAARLLA
uniref:ATPase n=1 Tax=Acidobacterium capsulatum TaxID=33075 RepID=A0A7V5CS04_9BACT